MEFRVGCYMQQHKYSLLRHPPEGHLDTSFHETSNSLLRWQMCPRRLMNSNNLVVTKFYRRQTLLSDVLTTNDMNTSAINETCVQSLQIRDVRKPNFGRFRV